jgi:hypothetical protein
MRRRLAGAVIALLCLLSNDFDKPRQRKLCGAMSMETQRLPDRLDWDNLATDALELAGLTADAKGSVFAKGGRCERKTYNVRCRSNIRCDTRRLLLATGEPSSPGSTALWADDAHAGIARLDWEK